MIIQTEHRCPWELQHHVGVAGAGHPSPPTPVLPLHFKKKSHMHWKSNSSCNFFIADAPNGKWSLGADTQTKENQSQSHWRESWKSSGYQQVQSSSAPKQLISQTCTEPYCAPGLWRRSINHKWFLPLSSKKVGKWHKGKTFTREFKFWLWHLIAARSWTSNFTSVSLCFPIFKWE